MDDQDRAEIELAKQQLLELYGVRFDETTSDQLEVFMQAVCIFAERNRVYADGWKQYGCKGNLISVAGKTDRMMRVWFEVVDGNPIHKDDLDDAFDLLNFATFFIRNYREGNMVGSPPDRSRLNG